jgi:hypothetical protein
MELRKIFTYSIANYITDFLEEDYRELKEWHYLDEFISKYGKDLVLKSLEKRFGNDLINIRKFRNVGQRKELELRRYFGLKEISDHNQYVKISLHDFMEYQELKKKLAF